MKYLHEFVGLGKKTLAVSGYPDRYPKQHGSPDMHGYFAYPCSTLDPNATTNQTHQSFCEAVHVSKKPHHG